MLTPGDKSTISDFMQSLSQRETVSTIFPYNKNNYDSYHKLIDNSFIYNLTINENIISL